MTRPRRNGSSRQPVSWAVLPSALLGAVLTTWVASLLLVNPAGIRPIEALPGSVGSRLLAETALCSGLAFAWLAAAHTLSRRIPRLPAWTVTVAASGLGLVHLLATVADSLIYRHLGHRLGLFMLAAYRLEQNPGLLAHFLSGDALFVGLAAAALALAGAAAVVTALRGFERPGPAAVLSLFALALATSAGAAVSPSPGHATLSQPASVVLVREARQQLRGRGIPADFARSIRDLRALLGHPESSYTRPGYPLWRDATDEKGSLARFAARPLSERPDVIMIILESARGWEFDVRNPTTEQRIPELVRLFREGGLAYVHAHSNGFPSLEGWASINLGIWCNPERLIMARPNDGRVLSLPAVLGRAGYHRTLVATERFEPIQPWYRSWYDVLDLDPALSFDDALVDRLIVRYEAAPKDRPRLLTLITISTHPPYSLPPGQGFPDQPRARYLRAVAHMDQALGRLFAHLRRSPRWKETIVVAVGDHSTTNGRIALRTPRIGTPNAGETWTAFLLGLPGSKGGVVDERVVSHVDVAPTVLGLLGLDVSNAFMGRDLSDPTVPDIPALAFHFDGAAVIRGSTRLHFRLDNPAFLTKFRWNALLDPATAPVEHGNYDHGIELAPTDEDRASLEPLRRAAAAYTFLLEEDLVIPPGTPGVTSR